jgi:uncharacterized membrane protein YphA (DoxX/SURF4 family)
MIVTRPAASGWLLIFRLYAGAFWLIHGIPKFLNPAMFMPPNGYMGQMIARATQTSTGFYHDFLVHTVTPNIGLFAELVRLGEVLTGISLLLGFLTPLGGLVGCFLALNYLAAAGEFHWSGVGTLNGVALALSFFCMVLPVGRFAGIDALLVRRPNTRAVKAEFVDEPIAAPRAPPD